MRGAPRMSIPAPAVAVEIWADRVELWMGDGRKIQVLRRDLMGA